MRILWLSWKDSGHPHAGGAEVVLHELIRRQVKDGHQVTMLTAAYPGAKADDMIDGARIIRVGRNRYTHSFRALWFYWSNLYNKYDMVIEVVNTAPYFVSLMPGRAHAVVLYHQLAREVWLHEARWPLNRLGFHILEPVATRLLARSKATVLSMSPSTSQDLLNHGFAPKRLHVLTEGIHLKPLADLNLIHKYDRPTLLSLGSIRRMKRTLDQIRAFELIKERVPTAQLYVAGAPHAVYGQAVLDAIAQSKYKDDIHYEGKITHARKQELMQRSHLIMVTSVKEGWGLIVSEANSQGTPAVVYDADGLRDSVKHGKTGLVCEPTPEALAKNAAALLKDHRWYLRIRRQAHEFSQTLTFDQTYADFKQAVKK